jgi:RND family efflux transporter MFP subunit
MKRRGLYILMTGVVVILAFLVFQVSSKQSSKDADTVMIDKALPVTISSVAKHEFADEVSAIGTMKAREISLLSPKVAGQVNQVLVDIGDRVKVGQVVIILDSTNITIGIKEARAALAAAESAIPQANAQFEQAEKEYRRADELLKEKVISQSRFDQSEAAFKTAREVISSAMAQRDQAKAALETVLEYLKDTQIRSSISGTVVERNVEIGQVVAPGIQLLRIIDQTSLKLDASLPEADMDRVAIETEAVITTDTFPDHEFYGKVTVVNPMVDRKTRTFLMRIEVPNPSEKLVDGMFARVKVQVDKRSTLAVPRNALQRIPGSGTYYVFVVEENKACKRTVEIGATNDQYAEVKDGLAENENVIISRAGRLRSDTEVHVLDVSNKNETDKSEGINFQ